jgi:hypothetical protein
MDLKIDMLGGTLAGILIWSAQGLTIESFIGES